MSTSNGRSFHVGWRASCITRSVVYLATCKVCRKQYVGNTSQKLRDRVTGHRNSKESALYCHLKHHDGSLKFNDVFTFQAITQASPDGLLELESVWIHRLRTEEPEGLNRVEPCALSTGIPT
jgi:hypothetical protein